MRVGAVRWIVLAALLSLVAGCSGLPGLVVEPASTTVRVGEKVGFTASWNAGGLGGCMQGAQDVSGEAMWFVDGKRVDGPTMAFDKPGDYAVSADAKGARGGASVKVVGEGETTSGGDVAMSTDTAEQADPATLEKVWDAGNIKAVFNGGTPPTFTLDRTRRIRLITTYHWNDAKGTSGGGSYTINSSDGKTFGPFAANRTAAGQGGVPNAYWYADVDFELPAGTYTLVDSDPGSWAQNADTGGVGMGAIEAEK